MCGIAGIVRLDPEAPRARSGDARAMVERLRHRGPDRRNSWASASGRCALGHARLGVIDLSTGDQPMPNEDHTVHVVLNGEIYNFRELREELVRAGHRFRSRSDTEVLVHGYEEWGDDLPVHIDGMFAFALWDEPRGRVLLARDRAGKKPLFWTRADGRFAFASEVKALLVLPWVADEMDPGALPYYLAYGYVPGEATFYRGIRKLPPATAMVVEAARMPGGDASGAPAGAAGEMGGWDAPGAPPGKIDVSPGSSMASRAYWMLDWARPSGFRTDREATANVRRLLGEAVERRLVSDVPLGAFLSGGIDSTLIVGLMRERIAGPLRTFSLGFADDPTYDETSFARLAAKRFGTEHTEFTVGADAVDLVDELVEVYDEPFGDSSAIPTYIVSRLTREHVTVALTGDGGDEMFCGYPRLVGMSVAEGLGPVLSRGGDAVGRLLPHHPNFRHPLRRAQRFFAAAALTPEERMLRWIGFFPEWERYARPDATAAPARTELLASFRAPWTRFAGQSALTRAMALTFETYLPDDLLVKADRCAMAHGLELRAPFLDTALMEAAASLPRRMRVRGRTLKWLLKHAFPDLLPPEIAHRGKQGFGVPLPVWFRTRWKGLFESRVLAQDARLWRWLLRPPVEALWAEHQAGGADHGHALWALLTLETWLRRRPG